MHTDPASTVCHSNRMVSKIYHQDIFLKGNHCVCDLFSNNSTQTLRLLYNFNVLYAGHILLERIIVSLKYLKLFSHSLNTLCWIHVTVHYHCSVKNLKPHRVHVQYVEQRIMKCISVQSTYFILAHTLYICYPAVD